MGRHYLYRHLIPDGPPFYIGIGTKVKSFAAISSEYRRAYALNKRNRFWKNIYTKYGGIEIEILFESDSYDEIKAKEIEFISLYGRRDLNNGILVNLTDGGEGAKGTILPPWTEERKTHTSKKLKAFYAINKHPPMSPAVRQVMSDKAKARRPTRLGSSNSLETRQKIRLANLGKKLSKETVVKRTQTFKMNRKRKSGQLDIF